MAIVILNYNGRSYLEKFLPSVLASSYPNKRVIVADNASTDDSLGFLRRENIVDEVIVLDKNYGFAEGYNQALKKVSSDFYVLLNSDVEVTKNWIEPIIALMESNKKIAACQPKILSFKQKELFEYAGAAGGWIDILGYPFARGRVFDICETDKGQYNDNSEIFWASGAAMFIRSAAFHEANGFDGFFFAHMEEIDLCWRLQLQGYSIMCCPQSVVYHVGGGTLPKGNSRKIFLNFRNNILMLCKNLKWQEKLWKLPLRFALDFLFAFKSLFTGNAASFIAICKTYSSVFVWMFSKKTPYPFNKKFMKKMQCVYTGSVLWAYLINKKKAFSEIVKKNF